MAVPDARPVSKGSVWRLTRTIDDVPVGTVVTVVEPTIDHLDWFAALVALPDGRHRRMPWNVAHYCEPVEP